MTYEDALAILRDGWPITPEDFTQIAARIWDEGYEAGEGNGYAIGRDIDTDEDTANPYRNETA